MSMVLPKIVFKIGRQKLHPATRKWLNKERDSISERWLIAGPQILRRVEKYCGFPFPSKTVTEGMTAYVYKRKKDDPNVGDMEETKPLEFNIYIGRSDSWKDTKRTIIHELIHCLSWQKFYFDYRTSRPSLFADLFADELVTSIVECMVIGYKPGPKSCRDALDYAMDDLSDRLKNEDRRRRLATVLMQFSEEYQRKIKRKESHILKEREEILNRLPSLLPETITS